MQTISTTDLAHRLRPVLTRLARRMRQEASGDLSPTQSAALNTIDCHGPLTPSELAVRERIQRPTVTRIVSLLEERGAAFFWIGAPGQAMLGLWSLGSAPMGLLLHIAFQASLTDVLGACDGLRSSGITPLSFFGDETSEPSVIGWMPHGSKETLPFEYTCSATSGIRHCDLCGYEFANP